MGKVKFMQPIEFVCDIVPLLITIIDGFLRIKCPGKRCGLVRHLRLVGAAAAWITSCCVWAPGDDGFPAKWWKSFPSAGDSITLSSPLHLAATIKRPSTRANKTILARSTTKCILVRLVKFIHWWYNIYSRAFWGTCAVFLWVPPPSLRHPGCCSERCSKEIHT